MTRKSHVLTLKRNVYGQKQADRVWNQYMDQDMKSIGFTEPIHGPGHEVHRFYSQQVRPLFVVPEVDRLLGLH